MAARAGNFCGHARARPLPRHDHLQLHHLRALQEQASSHGGGGVLQLASAYMWHTRCRLHSSGVEICTTCSVASLHTMLSPGGGEAAQCSLRCTSAQVFVEMCDHGVAVDVVTCCSLIIGMDKAGCWALAQVAFTGLCSAQDALRALTPPPLTPADALSPYEADLAHKLESCFGLPRSQLDADAPRTPRGGYNGDGDVLHEVTTRLGHVQVSPQQVRLALPCCAGRGCCASVAQGAWGCGFRGPMPWCAQQRYRPARISVSEWSTCSMQSHKVSARST